MYSPPPGSYPYCMQLELLRLMLGLILAAFHRPVSDFILEQEHALTGLARRGGIPIPAPLSLETSRTLFFSMGILVALLQIARIYLTYLHR
jgi:hypothetical protein